MEKFQELEDEVQAVRDQLQVGYACRKRVGRVSLQVCSEEHTGSSVPTCTIAVTCLR